MRKVLGVVASAMLLVGMLAQGAFAQIPTAVETSLNTAVSGTVGDLQGIFTTAVPIVVGLIAAVVGLAFVIRLIRRAARA